MICVKDERNCIRRGTTLLHRFLAKAALEGANTPLRCDVRSRRDLCVDAVGRNSETMFGKPFRTSSHQLRLSVTYLPAYSSLHRLCGIHLVCYLHIRLHVIGFKVNC